MLENPAGKAEILERAPVWTDWRITAEGFRKRLVADDAERAGTTSPTNSISATTRPAAASATRGVTVASATSL